MIFRIGPRIRLRAKSRLAAATMEGPAGVSHRSEPRSPPTTATAPRSAAQRAICSGVLDKGQLTDTSISVPEIKLENLGSDSGMDMRELAALLTRKVLEAVSKAGGGIPTDLASDLRGSLAGLGSSKSVSETREAAEKALDSVKGLFGRD